MYGNYGIITARTAKTCAFPKDFHMVVIALKDCFFTIRLLPEDSPKFAFSVPSINFRELPQRYQWVVLSRGRVNSSTLC